MASVRSCYRDDVEAVELRYRELLADRDRDARAAEASASIKGRREGRIVAGITGIAGVLLMVSMEILFVSRGGRSSGEIVTILFGTWGAMAFVYAAARIRAWVGVRLVGAPSRSDDRWLDVARLEAAPARFVKREDVDRLERASVALPLIAIALLAPLTIHACVYASILAIKGQLWVFKHFDQWIFLSHCLVGHAHLVLAWFCYRFAKTLKARSTDEISDEGRATAKRAFWWTVGASAPSGLYLLLPPVLTLLTGLLFCRAMFWAMSRRVRSERLALAV